MSEKDVDKITEELIEVINSKIVRDPKTVADLANNLQLISRAINHNSLVIKLSEADTHKCIIEIRERIDDTRAQMAVMALKIEELANAIFRRN